ncbi:hypothetical protein C8J56DRAFT_394887 [Mycena floridula]|nr:hypothetical protein C8J56DRAFT_394887 [Mycena floridula]
MALKFSSSSIKLQRQGPAAQSHTLVVTNTHNYPVAFKAFPTPNLTCSITPAIRKINAKSSVTVNIRICIKAEDAQFIRGALSFKSSLMPEQMNDVDQFWRALEGRDNGRSFADLLHTQNITISYADAAAANTIKLYPPDILDFSEDQTPTIMLVSNPSSRPVAIKIKVNNKAAYSVRHNVFRIEPEDTREVASRTPTFEMSTWH